MQLVCAAPARLRHTRSNAPSATGLPSRLRGTREISSVGSSAPAPAPAAAPFARLALVAHGLRARLGLGRLPARPFFVLGLQSPRGDARACGPPPPSFRRTGRPQPRRPRAPRRWPHRSRCPPRPSSGAFVRQLLPPRKRQALTPCLMRRTLSATRSNPQPHSHPHAPRCTARRVAPRPPSTPTSRTPTLPHPLVGSIPADTAPSPYTLTRRALFFFFFCKFKSNAWSDGQTCTLPVIPVPGSVLLSPAPATRSHAAMISNMI